MRRRVAMISLHTSPLDPPGSGDAGGLNVYVVELARRLAERHVDVEIFTRATSRGQPPTVDESPGVRVHHIVAGPFDGLAKDDLPARLCDFTHGLMRVEAFRDRGWFDIVHSHYWLSGLVGAAVAQRWGVPLVHTMHTMAKVKNSLLARGDRPEPPARIDGEQEVVDASQRLVANTAAEARALVDLYGADPGRVAVVHPGVDLSAFRPGNARRVRKHLGIRDDALLLAFAGRIQPLKAPDVLLRAAARLVARFPSLRKRLIVAVIGGPSGSGTEQPNFLVELAHRLGVADLVRFVPPRPQAELAAWFQAATLVAVPSYNESFGLVALEAQACGTPVVAAATGGLPTAVADGVSGLLVDGHDPADWADALGGLLADSRRLDDLRAGALRHAARFAWSATAEQTLRVYEEALHARRLAPAQGGILRDMITGLADTTPWDR